MRITLRDAADLLGIKPEVLRQQLTEGKAKLPPGTRALRRGQGTNCRWYLEFSPQTLADLRLAKARGPDAAKDKKPPAAAAPEASGREGPGAGGNQSEAKGGRDAADRERDGEGDWWF